MCSLADADDPDDPPADGDVSVVRPTADELLQPPRRDLLCPEPGCGRRLPQPSALRFHMARRHGDGTLRGSKTTPRAALYACPRADCADSGAAKKSLFSSMKALKQHYLKVHAPRTLVCSECKRAAFATEALLRAHVRRCGEHHQCSCGARYSCVDTLRTHAARHGHTTMLWLRPPKPPKEPKEGLRRLAPKPSPDALHLLANIALSGVPVRAGRPVSMCDAATQTAARRAPRAGRSSSTQTKLTSVADAETSAPPPQALQQRGGGGVQQQPVQQRIVTVQQAVQTVSADSRTAGSQCVAVAAASAASQAGPPLVWGLLWPAAGLISCQTQTEEEERVLEKERAKERAKELQPVPLEEILWEAQEEEEEEVKPTLPPPPLPLRLPPPPQRYPITQQTQTALSAAPWIHASLKRPPVETPLPLTTPPPLATPPPLVTPPPLATPPPPPPPPPVAGAQTETDMLSAETQTHDPFDHIKHLLRSEDEQLLFPELSELSGTDIQTQTPWLSGDSQQTQTPWWSDDPAPSVTHMETQTCLLCLGPCDCWGDS